MGSKIIGLYVSGFGPKFWKQLPQGYHICSNLRNSGRPKGGQNQLCMIWYEFAFESRDFLIAVWGGVWMPFNLLNEIDLNLFWI